MVTAGWPVPLSARWLGGPQGGTEAGSRSGSDEEGGFYDAQGLDRVGHDQVQSRLTAATTVDNNPYCSCKLTREDAQGLVLAASGLGEPEERASASPWRDCHSADIPSPSC